MSDKFNETIFLKEDSSLDNDLNELRRIPSANKNDIALLEKGSAGEKQVAYRLSKASIGMYVMRDINIARGDLKSQVDFVVVTSNHCYFIECKNYTGNVEVDSGGNFVLNTNLKGKNYKRGIESPLAQVDAQLAVFKKICNDDNNKIEKLSKVKVDDFFKTLVVFINPETILDLKNAPNDIKDRILKVDNVVRIIENDNKKEKLNKDEAKEIADYILSKNIFKPISSKVEIAKNQYIMEQQRIMQKRKEYNERINAFAYCIAGFGVFLSICFIVFAITALYSNNQSNNNSNNFNNNNNNMSNNNNSTTQKYAQLTDNQKQAINTIKLGFNNSKINGFEVIHMSNCKEISAIFDNKISCTSNPSYFNYLDNNKITIYNNFSCFNIQLSSDGNSIVSKDYKIYSFNKEQCDGQPIGFSDWDPDNEFFKKIGGYETIRKLALYTYKNNKVLDTNQYSFDNVKKRGGNVNYSVSYKIDVDNYLKGLTDKGSGVGRETNRENTNKMCEGYYYIMK